LSHRHGNESTKGIQRSVQISAPGEKVLIEFCFHGLLPVYISPETYREQDLAPFQPFGGGLLARLRACLSALLYKSAEQKCFPDYDVTNVY
jgi:hypothetical protein